MKTARDRVLRALAVTEALAGPRSLPYDLRLRLAYVRLRSTLAAGPDPSRRQSLAGVPAAGLRSVGGPLEPPQHRTYPTKVRVY